MFKLNKEELLKHLAEIIPESEFYHCFNTQIDKEKCIDIKIFTEKKDEKWLDQYFCM